MRTINALKNFLTTILPYVIITFLGFFKTRGLIINLGDDIYSINQVFYQIFTYLSLVEGGISIIVIQKYYKLLINKDTKTINIIYSSSKKFLKKIAYIILSIGIIVSFGLKFITKNELSLMYLQVVFVLYLFRNLVDYFMFSPRFIIQADQKAYKINWCINLFRIIELIVEIILIYSKVNYLIILIPSIFTRIIMNILINKIVKIEYPWLKETEKVDMSLLSDTKDFWAHRVANIVYNNTDLLVISTFLNSYFVVVYSGYNYIITVLNEIMNIITESVVPSLGNAINKESTEKSYEIFEEQNSLFAFFAMLFSSCTIILIKSFVCLWIGPDKILDTCSIVLIVFSMYNLIYSKIITNIINIKGWFKETKNMLIYEAIINVVLSIVFVKYFGVLGVVSATVISTLLTKFFMLPNFIYKKQFNKKANKYYSNFLKDLLFLVLITFLVYPKTSQIIVSSYLEWIGFATITGMVAFITMFIYKSITTKEFRNIIRKIYYATIGKIKNSNIVK